MKIFIVICGLIIIACLVAERRLATRHRFALRHVIHVNGTRGKSGVTRLIAAGLSEGGVKTYCKTTGTLPMTIDTKGNEKEIKRLGPANISEQIKTLRDAANDGAEVLVIECMAVDPELQYICENKILKSDIGVITNARVDHVAEMGETVYEVCNALSNTIPKNGTLFTADTDSFEQMKLHAAMRGSEAILADDFDFDKEEFMFPENIALALAVCEKVGVDKKTALCGMRKVKPDPYESDCYDIGGGVTFVNGMSANDPDSTRMVFDKFKSHLKPDGKLIFVLNLRPDRGYRTNLMIDYVIESRPDEVWLMGAGSSVAARKLRAANLEVKRFRKAEELPLQEAGNGGMIYAIGNIANEGFKLMDIVWEKEGR